MKVVVFDYVAEAISSRCGVGKPALYMNHQYMLQFEYPRENQGE